MVSRAQYDEAKRVLEEVRYELDTQPLTPDQRRHAAAHRVRRVLDKQLTEGKEPTKAALRGTTRHGKGAHGYAEAGQLRG